MFGVETRASKIRAMQDAVKQLRKEVHIERQKVSQSSDE